MKPRCRLCDGEARHLFRVHDLNRGLSEEQFDYFGCSNCGSICLAPIPADLSRYYPAEYYRLPANATELALLAEEERYKLEIVAGHRPGGRLLDIGPSVGAFAHLAKKAGYQVSTIEMDSACCAFLRRVVGVRAVQSDDPAGALEAEGDYDVITLWHVVEHLADPWSVIAAAAAKLAPGGLLVIAAPNPESLQFRLFGRYWMHLDAPRHLQLIPVAEVIRRAASHGLATARLTTTDRGALLCNSAGWQASTAHWLTDHSVSVLRWKLGSAAALLAKPLDRVGRLGSAYTVALTSG